MSYSQTTEIDSLQRLIPKLPDGQEKADNLLILAKNLAYEGNYAEAILVINQTEQLVNNLEYSEGIVELAYTKGYLYYNADNIDSAFIYHRNYLELCDSLYGDTDAGIKAYSSFGRLLQIKGQYDSSIAYVRKSIQHNKSIANAQKLIADYNLIGVSFNYKSAYDSALAYYYQALELCEPESFELYRGYMLVNIGKAHFYRNDFQRAKEYLLGSLELNVKYNKQSNLALAYTLLGNMANEEMELNLALQYYQQAEQICREIDDVGGINDMYLNYGEVYQKQGKYQLALKSYNKALEYYESVEHYHGIISANINKAATYATLKRFDEAEALNKTCIALTFKANDMRNRKMVYENLADLMIKKGDYKRAFSYQSRHMALKDSIFTIDKEKAINESEERYQKEMALANYLSEQNKNLKLAKEKAQSDNAKNIFLFSGSGSIIVLLLVFAYHKNTHRKNKIIAEQKIKQLEEEKKLLAARSIVVGQEQERKRIAKELHDGLGVLLSTAKMQFTTIKDKSPENKPLIDKARKLLEQAAGDVRKISHNMMPGLLTRYGFYEAVEDLFEQLNDMHGLTAKTAISGEQDRLPENTEIMLYRIVQEMANNTLKHAGATEVLIDIVTLPTQLSIDYSDNGKGFDVKQMLANKSIGLTNIQSRVNFLSGNMDLVSKPGEGINYHITIPLEKQEDEESKNDKG